MQKVHNQIDEEEPDVENQGSRRALHPRKTRTSPRQGTRKPQAKFGLRTLSSFMLFTPFLGMVSLDLGLFDQAKTYFADASALAKAIGQKDLKEESHVYRARVSLELRPGSRTAISSAIDRLSQHHSHKFQPTHTCDVGMGIAALGDTVRWNQAREKIIRDINCVSPQKQGRILFCLLRAACCIGDYEQAKNIIAIAKPITASSLLFQWEFGRAKALLTQENPPPTSPLALGLTPWNCRH